MFTLGSHHALGLAGVADQGLAGNHFGYREAHAAHFSDHATKGLIGDFRATAP